MATYARLAIALSVIWFTTGYHFGIFKLFSFQSFSFIFVLVSLVLITYYLYYCGRLLWTFVWGRRDRDRMVVGFTTTCAISAITTKSVISNRVHGDVYSIQHNVIKFVNDLWQVGGFLRVLRFPSRIKLTSTILLKYCWKWR